MFVLPRAHSLHFAVAAMGAERVRAGRPPEHGMHPRDEHQEEPPLSGLHAGEGIFDSQMALPFPAEAAPQPLEKVVKRDGREEPFDRRKIAEGIVRAAGSPDFSRDLADSLANAVALYLQKTLGGRPPTVDQVHDAVERVLIHMGHIPAALAHARHRERRARVRKLREGDFRAVMSELREARDGAPEGGFDWAAVRVRNSQGVTGAWDRDRIAVALVRESGLARELADLVAAEVEAQIAQAGIQTMTTSLLRELAGAKLVEHGLRGARDRQRRLGVPVYDTARILRGQTAESMHGNPETTGRLLADALKREYALAEVFSPEVAEAHLSGDLHLSPLARVDRLFAGAHDLAGAARHGVRLHGGLPFAPPPETPDTLLAQWLKWHSLLGPLFSARMTWDGANLLAAPFLENLSNADMAQFARMTVYEFAYHALTRGADAPQTRLRLCWSTPPAWKDREAVGPGGKLTGEPVGKYLPAARRLAAALLTVLAEGGRDALPFAEPVVEVVLDETVFADERGMELLGPLAALAGTGGAVRALFDRNPNADARPGGLRAQRVTLNLPRAAFAAGSFGGLCAGLDRLVKLAAQAHVEKRRFTEELLVAGDRGPLGLLAGEWLGGDALRAEDLAFEVAVTGLRECLDALPETAHADAETRAAHAARIMDRLAHACRDQARRHGFPLPPASDTDTETAARFARLDSGAHPGPVAALLEMRPELEGAEYTPGTALEPDTDTAPLPRLRREGAAHALMDTATAAVTLTGAARNPEEIVALLRNTFRETACLGLRFK
ncbi:MAG: hypothetical protein GX580_00245 [Candidatus Hydrogenedens sp.]|nr:hypothetical protein [Candidatus Hydrogenedens sp.]